MAEKEYIEAKDLDDFRNEIMDKFLSLCNYNDYNKLTLLRISETVDEVYDKYVSKPLADVVEVVRCKDCKYYVYHEYYSMHLCENCNSPFHTSEFSTATNPNDFCSYGERKEK